MPLDLRQGRARVLRRADRARAGDRHGGRSTHIAVVRAGFLRHFSDDEMRELATMFERALEKT